MKVVLLIEFVLIVLIVMVLKMMLMPKFKGWVGERVVVWMLHRLDARQYRVLSDIYLPNPDGTTTQIDHIVVSTYGIFVIETKNYKGWIFGDADSKVWTQCLSRKGFRTSIKNTFQNPIRQNYAHLCSLETCTGIPKRVMRSVIAFSGEATFKTERPTCVCYFSEVVDYIRSFATPVIKEVQVDEIIAAIREWQATLTKRQVASHVRNLKARHGCK